MGYTKYGEFMRIKRIENHEIMTDTSNMFGVALPFVSAVETGKRNVPTEWFDIIVEHYKLDESEQIELRNAIEQSKTQVKISLVGTNNYQREVAVCLQRSFDNIDEETANRIIDILSEKGDWDGLFNWTCISFKIERIIIGF